MTDRNKDGAADEVKRFAPSLSFAIPNGVCFSKDGFLYIAEQNRVRVFPAAEFFYESPDVATGDVVPQGELVPPDDELYNHTARVCKIGPDKKLYIQLGQPFNVPPADKLDSFKKWGIGGIIRMNQDGTGREIYADGMRNPVGMDFDPATGDLWTNDNQVDGMGDDIPAGELNHITAQGENFGFPWYGGGHTRTNEYKDSEPPADFGVPGRGTRRARRGSRPDVLHRQPVPGPLQARRHQHAAWLLEPHRAGWRAGLVHAAQRRRHCRSGGRARRRLADVERRVYRPSGRARDSCVTARILVSDDFAGAVYRISYGE